MREIQFENGVLFLQSERFSSPHGFSTRHGGVSTLPHTASLNLAERRGDSIETVLENLRLFSDAVGVAPESIVSVPQIHSESVETVTEEMAGEGYFRPASFACDGYVTDRKGVTLGVRTADCLPVLMEAYDAFGTVFAVSAVHAGWRGSVRRIVPNAVEKLVSLGAVRERIRVAIGPHICPSCFEVREDFRESVTDSLGEKLCSRFVLPDKEKVGVYHADLGQMNRYFLLEAGVREENIDIFPACTAHESAKYFSHRATGGKRGTMLSVIRLP